jgi:hypothetical protein
MDSPSAILRIIRSLVRRYILGTQATKHTRFLENSVQHEETTMRKTILTVLTSALIAASTSQIAAAAERHHAHKADRVVAGEQFRNANNSVAAPVQSGWTYGGYSAPAGH